MTSEMRPLDVADMPDLLRIAEEVEATGEARVLERGNKALAAIVPLSKPKRSKRRPSAKDLEAFRSAAGSWSNVDIDRFLHDNEASRRLSNRPPVDR